MAAGLHIHRVDPADLASLERHVAFETAHGTPRFTDAQQLQAWIPTVDAALLVVATDEAGARVGCATASIISDFGPGSIQLNAFCIEGRHEVLRRLGDAVTSWAAAGQATELLAHVSAPTPAQEQDWLDAGFECVGRRARVVRPIHPADADLELDEPAGIEVVALAARPELAAATLAVWNAAFRDVPSALPHGSMDDAAWRVDLGIGPNDPFPASLLVAVSGTDEVAGVAFVSTKHQLEGVGGHRFTGTAAAWRGRGVARALKAASIRAAARAGLHLLRATNDEGNLAMRAVNARFGYVHDFEVVMFRRRILR